MNGFCYNFAAQDIIHRILAGFASFLELKNQAESNSVLWINFLMRCFRAEKEPSNVSKEDSSNYVTFIFDNLVSCVWRILSSRCRIEVQLGRIAHPGPNDILPVNLNNLKFNHSL